MDEYVLIRRDLDGNVISAQPLEITNLTIERDGFLGVHRFRIEGFYDPITRESRPPDEEMPTGDAFMVRFFDPRLLSPGD